MIRKEYTTATQDQPKHKIEWEHYNQTVDALVAAADTHEGDVSEYLEEQPGYSELFTITPNETGTVVVQGTCIDGRIRTSKKNCLYLREGGSGAPLRDDDPTVRAEHYLQVADAAAKKSGAKRVEIMLTRHEDCGAEKLSGLSNEEIDRRHQQVAFHLQALATLRELEVVVKRDVINTAHPEGKGLAAAHQERALYFTAKDVLEFNPQAAIDARQLVNGFGLDQTAAANLDPEAERAYLLKNIVVALGIAFSKSKFSPEKPFILMAAAGSKATFDQSLDLFAAAKQQFIEQQQGLSEEREKLATSIKLMGFIKK